MKNTGVILLVGLLCTIGCRNEDIYLTEDFKSIEYNQKWQELGLDPNRDWNMTALVSAKVEIQWGTGDEYTVQFYTDNPRTNKTSTYMVGDFKVQDGETVSLQMDVPKHVSTLYVACINKDKERIIHEGAIEGGNTNVYFGYQKAASRTAMADTEISEYLKIGVYSNETGADSWQEIPKDFFTNITSFLPENIPATTNPSIVTNFELIPVTENYSFTFFPVYSGTSYRDDVGFYIYDKSENDASLDVIKEGKIFDNQDVTEEKAVFQNYYTFEYEYDGKKYQGESWADKPLGWLYDARWRGRKITIIGKESKTPGKMQRIGFYIKPLKELKYDADGVFQGEIELQYFGTRYTNASLNDNTPYCTITPDANYYLLGLEDGWDKDGNDIVIAIPKTEVEYVDPESTVEGQFFTLAYEDMGAIGDFDFNDVVLRFERVSGVNTVPVYLMAAGGTLPTWVYFKYTETSGNTVYDLLGTEEKEAFTEQQVLTEDIESAEIHKLFGAPSHKTMVNTGSGITKDPVLLAKSLDLGDDYWVSREVNSFVIKVKTDDGSSIMVSTPNRNNGDKAPQGLCLPNEWQWPKERSSIVKAYPSIKNSNSETNTDDNAENYGDVNWYLNDKANKDEIWIGT